jgi:transcriptional regulator with XRE-family HTH domain
MYTISITIRYFLENSMSQSVLLIQALKQLLKSQNLTYQAVAKHLDLSEVSVKRLFTNNQLSLGRIDAICEMLGIEISDLLQQMQQMSKRVSDRKLCLVAICVINRWSFAEILKHYKLSEQECLRCLIELDKLKLIELLPKNKIKLLISPNFHWIANGPIQQFFQRYILTDFIESNFQQEHEEMLCQFGMLTKESNAVLRKKLQRLAEEFQILSQQDAGEKIEKRFGNACVLMLRPWVPRIFQEFEKA